MIGYLRSLYPQLTSEGEDKAVAMISAWTELFRDVDVDLAKEAVVRYAKDNPSAFAPSASQVYGIAKSIRKPAPLRIPESTDAKCIYGCCDGRGFELYDKWNEKFQRYYVTCCWCPCEYDRQIREARETGKSEELINSLYRQRSYWEKRMKNLKRRAL